MMIIKKRNKKVEKDLLCTCNDAILCGFLAQRRSSVSYIYENMQRVNRLSYEN